MLVKPKNFMVGMLLIAVLILFLGGLPGCADTKATGTAISAVALTAPGLASALDNVYAALIAAKTIPDHQADATKALASLDAIAPMVQSQGAALSGDKFNWASFVIEAAMTAVKVMGVWS
jgi:hypothetical protein